MSTTPASKPNMRRSKLSGWQMTNRRMLRDPVMPIGSSRWELLLYRLAIAEHQVIPLMVGKSEVGLKIKDWVRRHYNSAYVPERVLEYLNIDTRWVS